MTTDDFHGGPALTTIRVCDLNQLEADLAAARAAQIAAQVEVGKWRSDFDVAREREEELRVLIQARDAECDAARAEVERVKTRELAERGRAVSLEMDYAALRQMCNEVIDQRDAARAEAARLHLILPCGHEQRYADDSGQHAECYRCNAAEAARLKERVERLEVLLRGVSEGMSFRELCRLVDNARAALEGER